MFRSACLAAAVAILATTSTAQITSFPYLESFDQSSSPPSQWTVVGWTVSTTSPRSSPHCLSATGNTQTRTIATPPVDFGRRIPDRISFYERRTSTALRYRLMLSAVSDAAGAVVPLGRWDSAATANTYIERTVELASSGVDGSRIWRFVWEVLRDSTNSTGVLRVDDIQITTAPAVDISPVRVECLPRQPRAGETISATIFVRNSGRSSVEEASLTVRWSSRLGDPGSSVQTFRLNASDSTHAFASIPTTQPGRIEITAVTAAVSDDNASNDTSRVSLVVGIPPAAAVVNEVQFAPLRENEPEWVELFNPGPWTIPLSDVSISDNSTSRASLTTHSDELLRPGEFVVAARSEEFSAHFPNTRYLLSLFPSLNNTTPDAVVLRDVHGWTIDSVAYQPGWTIAGRSLERRDWDMASWDASTWGSSEAAAGATPCAVNSIRRPEIDASCEGLTAAVDPGTISLHLTALVRNRGRMALPAGSVDWSMQIDDSTLGGWRFLGTSLLPPIQPSDSLLVGYRWTEEVRGPVNVSATITVPGDERSANDTSRTSLLRPYESGSLLVNEVMLEPAPGKPEWIELVNAGRVAVDLAGWTIMDLPSASGSRVRTTLPLTPTLLRPGHMAVVASDAGILDDYPWLGDGAACVIVAPRGSGFGFNNDGDAVVLLDRTGLLIDSVLATRTSHVSGVSAAGRSLERRSLAGPALDPSAWSSCADPMGATPGRGNSIARPAAGPAFSVRIDPDPFSPDGDAFEDVTLIHYSSSCPSLFLDVRVFDLSGREVRRLAEGGFVPSQGSVSWDGRGDAGRFVPVGVYIVLLTATDAVSGRQERARLLSSVAR
ncbi:MAG: lamin tail domain-containing protein [Bacteroidetes bacterium]|jgi:hypothetical protein|nr:lamin tail domain-containing protein [Bacteroidota bacterium]